MIIFQTMKYYLSHRNINGDGLLNSAINSLPFEIHIPGYNFCGPGTKLKKRLERGDVGVNSLDEACKTHDITYSQSKELFDRHQADKVLLKNALSRISSNDATWQEKLASMGVSAAMQTKLKFGMGKTSETIPLGAQSFSARQTMNVSKKVLVKIMEESIKVMQKYLKEMVSLSTKLNNSGKVVKKTQIKKKRLVKKNPNIVDDHNDDDNNENIKHIDNYHEKKIKELINRNKRKRKSYTDNDGMDQNDHKRKKIEEKMENLLVLKPKSRKRKVSESYSNADSEENMNIDRKRIKTELNELLSTNNKRKHDKSDSDDYESEFDKKLKKIKKMSL